jgi:hypothetical protein
MLVSLIKFSPANANLNDLPNMVLREVRPTEVAQIALGDDETSDIPVP